MELRRKQIRQQIIHWAENEPNVYLLVEEGAIAKERFVDQYSDLDINVFGQEDEILNFAERTDWLMQIAEPLWYIPLDFEVPAARLRSLLVIFENGVKVDFSFWKSTLLEAPFPYYEKYRVLLDKQQYSECLPAFIRSVQPVPLEQQEFERIVRESWFDLHYVAKFGARRDAFFVQSMLQSIRTGYLLPLLEEVARLDGATPEFSGRKMAYWLDARWLDRLPEVYAHWGESVLPELLSLLEDLQLEVARKRGFQLDLARISRMKKLLLELDASQ
ncbi:aminoglycoside 6-adenylyltransferase [Listeria costaricensis]|uniref:aminoglycoside 6-adenylyltransferase n=1 Tax=Listeria costaricensis TaxID=2026604 RepID=UPI000C076206|nr:aminoglycoside 6-adenylyltransferase [Listeria costaricensis]